MASADQGGHIICNRDSDGKSNLGPLIYDHGGRKIELKHLIRPGEARPCKPE
jgi:hypothetical protein